VVPHVGCTGKVEVATGDSKRQAALLQTSDERFVAGVVGQSEDQNSHGEHKAGQKPAFVGARAPNAVAQAERHHEIHHVVHEIVELNAVERRRATQAGDLAVDVIEQIPELPEDCTGKPTCRSAPAKTSGGR
jgi:hypothetical protein